MQIAWGITSPNNTMATTDIKIAYYDGTIRSKNIGRVSKANALHTNKVTNNQWWFRKIYLIFFALIIYLTKKILTCVISA